MKNKLEIIITGTVLILWAVIHCKIILNEYRTIREGKYYLWWDLVDIKTMDQKCKASSAFKNLKF